MRESSILLAIPTFENFEASEITLLSCLQQTLPTRILVVDNASTDQTFQRLQAKYAKYTHVIFKQNVQNRGRTGNWNEILRVFRELDEEYLKFVFSGDEILPTCVEECQNVIDNNPSLAAIAFQYLFNWEKYASRQIIDENLSGLLSANKVRELNLISGGFLGSIICNVYSKKAIGSIEFNEIYVGKTDFDFQVLDGKQAYYIPKVLAVSNIDSRGTFEAAASYWFECEAAFNRSYWLEKKKSFLTLSQYEDAKKSIFSDLIYKSLGDFSFGFLCWVSMNILIKKIQQPIINFRSRIQLRKRLSGILNRK